MSMTPVAYRRRPFSSPVLCRILCPMNHPWVQFVVVAVSTVILLSALAVLLTSLARAPRWLGDIFARAPALDLIVALFTWVPWVAGASKAGWAGLLAALVGQVAT